MSRRGREKGKRKRDRKLAQLSRSPSMWIVLVYRRCAPKPCQNTPSCSLFIPHNIMLEISIPRCCREEQNLSRANGPRVCLSPRKKRKSTSFFLLKSDEVTQSCFFNDNLVISPCVLHTGKTYFCRFFFVLTANAKWTQRGFYLFFSFLFVARQNRREKTWRCSLSNRWFALKYYQSSLSCPRSARPSRAPR